MRAKSSTKPPPVDLAAKERAILGALLCEQPSPLPPTIARLIHAAPESFDDGAHGQLAVAIRQAGSLDFDALSKAGANLSIVAALMGSALPLGIAEVEAQELWGHYTRRRVSSVAQELTDSLAAHPDQAEVLAKFAAQTLVELSGEVSQAAQRNKLTLRTPDEILAMTFDDSDVILGDRLAGQGQPFVIAAASGAGKSRILMQLSASVVSRREFLGFKTGCPHLRWLIIQTENSNRRLHNDLSRIKAWLGADWHHFAERVVLHTIENDLDGFVNLDNPDSIAAIETAIAEARADVVCFDPLNEFAIGDLNKDQDMRATLQTLSRVARRGNPLRAIFVLHHAITGRGGAAKATGYDRASFARNSKSLHAWTRGQINLAAADPDNNDALIVACGKSSNGREFKPFGVRLNLDSFIYEVDPAIDVSKWEMEIGGQADKTPLMTPERVAEFCRVPTGKPALVKAIREDCGCTRESSYRYIRRAEQAKTIKFNATHEHYTSR
jgi:hypothetical protein